MDYQERPSGTFAVRVCQRLIEFGTAFPQRRIGFRLTYHFLRNIALQATDPQILTSLLKPHGHGRSAMMEFFMPDQENARIAHEVLMKDVRPPVEEGEEEMEERLVSRASSTRIRAVAALKSNRCFPTDKP